MSTAPRPGAAEALAPTVVGTRKKRRFGGAAPGASPDARFTAWPTRIVVVIASFNGTLSPPEKRRGPRFVAQHNPSHWHHNTSNLTFVVYQRKYPDRPNYSPNYGFEGGVIVQFVVEHYAALPDVTVFMQDMPWQHNPNWYAWTQCMKPNVTYAPFSHARLSRLYRANAQTDPGTDRDDALTEQCWRNMLDAFGIPLLLPREQPVVGYFQGSTFAASRDTLRATSLLSWRTLHSMMAGGDGRCHVGPLQWERLSVVRRPHTVTLDTPDARGKHTSANAFEALQGVMIGGLGREEVFSYDFCDAFFPNCPQTPCGRTPCRGCAQYVKQMRGRIEHERRRLAREYSRVVHDIRVVGGLLNATATAAPPHRGASAAATEFERRFGHMLGRDPIPKLKGRKHKAVSGAS